MLVEVSLQSTTEQMFATSETLKPYVPRLVVDWLREHGNERHRLVEGSLAFIDISGFTQLTERLARKGKVGAEEMNDPLNSCFTELLSVAYEFGAEADQVGRRRRPAALHGAGHEARACRGRARDAADDRDRRQAGRDAERRQAADVGRHPQRPDRLLPGGRSSPGARRHRPGGHHDGRDRGGCRRRSGRGHAGNGRRSRPRPRGRAEGRRVSAQG